MKRTAAIVATSLMMLAAATPAMAQTAVDDSVAIDDSTSTTYSAGAQNVVGSIETGNAAQYGDATAAATDGSAASASVDADLDTSVSLVNRIDLDHDGVVTLHELFLHFFVL